LFALDVRSQHLVLDINAPPLNAICSSINHALPAFQIQQHPFHPNHALVLVEPKQKLCNACGKNCSECDFNLHFTCASCSHINNYDDYQHAFISFFKRNQFTCEACGEEGKELASLCSICQLFDSHQMYWIFMHHQNYKSLPLPHSHIFSLSSQRAQQSFFVNSAIQKVKAEYVAYYSQECSYVATWHVHLNMKKVYILHGCLRNPLI
jgi:hypothetical protein